jgi:hypothetical protein
MVGESLEQMECWERIRLARAYFSALDEQRRIGWGLTLLIEGDRSDLMNIGTQQLEAAVEETYATWHAFNEHLAAHRCGG